MPVKTPSGRLLPRLPEGDDRWDPSYWVHWVDEVFAPVPRLASHSKAVWHWLAGCRRHGLAWLEPERMSALELAGLLHDIGRALDPEDAEPHGFVGGRFLDDLGLPDVAALVAHHSGARLEAAARGMTHLDRWGTPDRDLLAILTYADRAVSPWGDMVSLPERRADLVQRYGAGSAHVRRFDLTLPEALHGQRLVAVGRSRR